MNSQFALPRLVICNSVSVDARLALSADLPLMSDPRWPASAGYRMALATGASVILEGSGSLVTDGRPPEVFEATELGRDELGADFLPAEVTDRARGWFVVLDSRGRLRWQFKEFPDSELAGWHLLVAVTTSTPLEYLAFLRRQGIPYLVAGQNQVDLARLLRTLGDLFGTETVAATGGSRLGGALLRAGVVAEMHLELLPMAVGGTRTPTLFTGPDLDQSDKPVQLRLISVERGQADRVLLRYAVTHAD